MITRRRLVAATVLAGASLGTARAQDMRPSPKPGKRAWAAQVPVIRVGLLGGENNADRLQRVDGYRKLLEETFQVPVKLLQAADYAGVIQGFAAGQVDLAYMSPAAYAAAWIESNGNVMPLLTSQEADGSTSYVAVLYVRADSGITSLEQLKGKALAWADPNSASGYLIPRSEFRVMGIDPEPGKYFARTGFAGGHEQAVIAVLGKQYDAGVTWSSGVGDVTQGYTRGALRTMVEKKLLDMKDLRIIWKSRPIENGPLTVRADTPAEFRADIVALHRAIPVAYPDIFHAMDMGSSKDWVPVKHEDYAVFVDMLKAEAAQRRRR
ncbi:phosphate/phosphite/phosphonate ABC transporter substrate-binding protein [Rhodovastum sp. RN2-1]|uniref:Phosphate/phosphite/phosphonate ABC transporter substrate-binding protein n=2 Tax=Limobrevibacterium gyesilva TaxID=2991712 RepID=A0AA41YP53_9PROT|nr:phosphate/phosphite/phosphonate ABC transporter substrate-binding protein [Limobrevibacterium gyesilva]